MSLIQNGSFLSDYVLLMIITIDLFLIPAMYIKGLADGTTVVCFQINGKKNGVETKESKEYVLTQYNGREILLEVKLANRPNGMTEVTFGLEICLALSFR